MVCAFEARNTTIGTIRVLPLGHQLAPSERWIAETPAAAVHRQAAWEVGRLVMDPCFRAGAELLAYCLYLALLHLVESMVTTHLFATCTPILARLYRRFGFTIVSDHLPAQAGGACVMIHGEASLVLQSLARWGLGPRMAGYMHGPSPGQTRAHLTKEAA